MNRTCFLQQFLWIQHKGLLSSNLYLAMQNNRQLTSSFPKLFIPYSMPSSKKSTVMILFQTTDALVWCTFLHLILRNNAACCFSSVHGQPAFLVRQRLWSLSTPAVSPCSGQQNNPSSSVRTIFSTKRFRQMLKKISLIQDEFFSKNNGSFLCNSNHGNHLVTVH